MNVHVEDVYYMRHSRIQSVVCLRNEMWWRKRLISTSLVRSNGTNQLWGFFVRSTVSGWLLYCVIYKILVTWRGSYCFASGVNCTGNSACKNARRHTQLVGDNKIATNQIYCISIGNRQGWCMDAKVLGSVFAIYDNTWCRRFLYYTLYIDFHCESIS